MFVTISMLIIMQVLVLVAKMVIRLVPSRSLITNDRVTMLV